LSTGDSILRYSIRRYDVLFSVDLRHEYYTDARWRDCVLVPLPRTAALLARYRLQCKLIEDQFVVFTRVGEDEKPFTSLPSDATFTFQLECRRPDFSIITNVDAQRARAERFYFSNLANNAATAPAGVTLNLSLPAPAFDAGATYRPGDVVADGAGLLFEALQLSVGRAPAASPDFWGPRGAVECAGTRDLVQCSGPVVNLRPAASAAAFDVEVFGLNRTTGAYDLSLLHELETSGTAGMSLDVDLAALEPGRYRVRVNGEDFWVYRDAQFAAARAVGIVEIFALLPAAESPAADLPASDAYALLNAEGKVRRTAYTIRFAARRAFWKYFTSRHLVTGLLLHGTSDAAPFAARSLDPAAPTRKDFFQSDHPLPLGESPTDNVFDLQLLNAGGGDPPPAPKPNPELPGLLTQDYDDLSNTYTNYYCNVHLNF
jgi:hypothetical protein